jgi:zinc D-Ala-D-Ala dipeptidase
MEAFDEVRKVGLPLRPGKEELRQSPMLPSIQSLRIAAPMLLLLIVCQCTIQRRSAIVPSSVLDRIADYDMVDIRTLLPDVAVEMRYATSKNLTGKPIYPPDMPCLLKRGTAMKLAKAQEALKKKGVSLRIWDAWRPAEVQHLFIAKAGNTGMFLNPKVAWSQHCQGTAVDVTLVDLQGRQLAMPTEHDDNGVEAYFQYSGDDPAVKANVGFLQRAMEDAGFQLLDTEWWHFNDADYVRKGLPPIYAKDLGVNLLQ